MKKIITWTLLLAMLLGMFAGCGSTQPQATDPVTVDPTVAEVQPDDNLAGAIAYLKAMYKDAGSNTPADFERTAVVRVANIPYAVEWTVNVDENAVRIVPGEKSVTVDVNETVTTDTPYTLTATITGTDGTTATASWDHFIPASLGSDYGAIVDMGYALEEGAALDGMATLAGVITSVDTPYDAGYKNITVTIQVEGREDKPIMCYRLKGEGAADLWIGDFITVKGTLKNYKGTIEFDAGCELVSVVKGENEKPVAPEDPAEILKAAYALSHGESLPYECTLTGVIVFVNAVYNPQYDNITVSMMVGDKGVRCFRLKGEGVDTLNINDTITVTGTLMNYNGIIEFGSGCSLDDVVQREAPKQPSDPKAVVDAAYALEPGFYLPYYPTLTGTITKINTAYSAQYCNITVTMVVAGREDKPIECFRMSGPGADTLEVGDVITVKGYLMNYEGKGFTKVEYSKPALLKVVKGEKPVEPEKPADPADGSTLTVAEAIALGASKAHNEYTTGKYYVTGVITEVYNTTYGNMKIKDAAGNILTVYGTYSADGSTRYDKMDVKPVAGDTVTVYGIIGQYNDTPQLKNGWITAHTPAGGTTDPSEPTEPETPADPADGSTLTVAQALELGASKAHNTYTTGKYYVTGVITEVYNTTYGNMKITDGAGNILTIYGTYSADGKTRYDKMEVKPVVGDTVTIYGIVGQFSGTPQIKNGWVTIVPAEVEDPAANSTLTVAQAIELGASKDHNTYTEGKYYVTGVITEVYNTTYGNMKITDGAGNILTIYGTYSADGSTRYDKMDVKPVVGDTVTIYGIVGQFSGTPQIKNGWITSHTPAGGSTEPSEPTEPETPVDPAAGSTLTVAEAIALGASKDHNVYTSGMYYVSGVITEVYNTTYGNMKITDGAGNILTIYGTYSADGSTRYDKMAVKPVAGDTVTVYGIIGQFNGTPQVKNGWVISHTPAGGNTEPSEPETPAIPEVNASSSLAEIKDATMKQPAGFAYNFTITLEGAASQVGQPSTNRGDITFYVSGVQVYRLKCAEFDQIKNGDLIVVSGKPTHRTSNSGNPVFALTECTLISRTAG